MSDGIWNVQSCNYSTLPINMLFISKYLQEGIWQAVKYLSPCDACRNVEIYADSNAQVLGAILEAEMPECCCPAQMLSLAHRRQLRGGFLRWGDNCPGCWCLSASWYFSYRTPQTPPHDGNMVARVQRGTLTWDTSRAHQKSGVIAGEDLWRRRLLWFASY